MTARLTQRCGVWVVLVQSVPVPVIANGGIEHMDDVLRCLEVTGAAAVMSSEAVLENPGLFSRNIDSLTGQPATQVASYYQGGRGRPTCPTETRPLIGLLTRLFLLSLPWMTIRTTCASSTWRCRRSTPPQACASSRVTCTRSSSPDFRYHPPTHPGVTLPGQGMQRGAVLDESLMAVLSW